MAGLDGVGEGSVRTMSSRYYQDPEVFEREKEKIFYRTWQFVAHVSALPDPGSFLTAQIADESLLVARGQDGEIRAFYNVCRHRAHRVAEGAGSCRSFVCPYHAWGYDLEGRLIAAPKTEQVAGFDKTAVRLRPVRLEVFCGLIFVNLDDQAPAMDALYPGLAEEILAAKPRIAHMVPVFEDVIGHDCNWKVSVENFSECYHCPVVHKYVIANLYAAEGYRIAIDGGVVRHSAVRRQEREVHGDLLIWFLWPNLAIEIFPMHRSLSVRHFRVEGPRRASYAYLWYADPDLSGAATEEVRDIGRKYRTTNGAEDARLVASVQKGLESRAYDRGQLVITPEVTYQSEHAVAHFQALYLAALEGSG
ncbi:MAG: aromatic ring-hydroxylating dioxygenase subunit alpha [Pseudomonadota bacterium]